MDCDGFHWMNRFGDPGYRYHVLLARIWGTLALRLANADLLPIDPAARYTYAQLELPGLTEAAEEKD